MHYDLKNKSCPSYWKLANYFSDKALIINDLNSNYKRILEVLRKVSKEQLLTYQRRKPKMSDLELISLSLTAEFMSIDSENDLFMHLPELLLLKIERSV